MNKSVAVIGAGMAGVGVAKALEDLGCRAVVFEKSRGWGGRCATNRLGEQTADHGAQYFTMRDAEFRSTVEAMCGELVRRIEGDVVDEGGDVLPDDGRFYHVEGNSRLARALGAGLEVRSQVTVGPCEGTVVCGERFDAVVSTAPLPQTFSLAGVKPGDAVYVPCLTAVFFYEQAFGGRAADRYAVSDRSGHALAWSACENHKTGRIAGDLTVIVAQAGERFSREYLEAAPDAWSGILREMVEERWELPATARGVVHTHRWRYARVAGPQPEPVLPPGWFFAGDAVRESRVEAAWLAGREVARRVLASLGAD